MAGGDSEILAIGLQALIDLDFDATFTGVSLAEVDLTLDQARESSTESAVSPEDVIPEPPETAVNRLGDLWHLGRHWLLCGDARSSDDVARLMAGETANLIFTDPPYNVPIDGHVGGLGSVQHRDFAFAAGEMSREQFTGFLQQTLGNAVGAAKDVRGELPGLLRAQYLAADAAGRLRRGSLHRRPADAEHGP